MAVIFEDALKTEIKKEQANVYILLGDDGYLKKMYLEKISSKIAPSDDIFNFQKFSSDVDLQEVYDSVLQFPMMNDKKCVILCDYDFEHASKNDLEKLCTIISETPDTCVFILWFDSMEIDYKKNNKFKKILSSCDAVGGITAVLNHRKTPELVKMLTDGASKRGCRLDGNAARYLVETAGEDINTLKNELDKLCFFAKSGDITKEMVDKVSIKTVEAGVYELSKQISKCDIKSALKTLDGLFFMKLEPIIILSTISSYYVDLYRAFVGKEKGLKVNEIAQIFGYKTRTFVVENAYKDLNKFDFNKLSLSFEALREADKSLKSFSLEPRTILEQLIVKLGYIMAKGEKID